MQIFVNLVAKPSQQTGVPYPVINRAIFGVKGANIPAIIRGLIAVAWYGVQTYLAAESLNIIFLKFFPASQALTAATRTTAAFLGLPDVGVVRPGAVADLLLLDANPLDDIANTTRISEVYLRGERLDRRSMRASFK